MLHVYNDNDRFNKFLNIKHDDNVEKVLLLKSTDEKHILQNKFSLFGRNTLADKYRDINTFIIIEDIKENMVNINFKYNIDGQNQINDFLSKLSNGDRKSTRLNSSHNLG